MHRWEIRVTQPELAEDPQDFIATRLLHVSGTLTGSAVADAALRLRAHGTVKVVLLTNRVWAYPWMMGALLAFIAYQLDKLAAPPAPVPIVLTVFEVLILPLAWHEYRWQRRRRTLGTPT